MVRHILSLLLSEFECFVELAKSVPGTSERSTKSSAKGRSDQPLQFLHGNPM